MNLWLRPRRRLALRALLSGAALPVLAFTSCAAEAQEVTTYTYDALARLTDTSITGGPSSGIATSTCFDAAGNRVQVVVGQTGGRCSSTPAPTPTPTPTPVPTPTPTPGPTNQVPVAVADYATFICSSNRTINLLTNDYDPDNHTPLALVSITSPNPSFVWANVVGTTSVSVGAAYAGTYILNYVVRDSLGATANGRLTVTVTDAGGKVECLPPPE